MPRAYVKISVYVPTAAMTRAVDGVHFENPPQKIRAVIGALTSHGVAVVGAYDNVTLTSRGTGRFRAIPGAGATPSSGEAGVIHIEEEEVITFVAPRRNLKKILAEIARNHPFETPAIEVMALLRHAYDGLPE